MTNQRMQRAQRIAAHYQTGATLEECGLAEGVSPMTAMRDLMKLRIARRRPDPAPAARLCAREGCTNLFRPTRRQLDQGYGKYCSNECDGEAHRIYPKPLERRCETCSTPFTPDSDTGWQDARGWNRYCSRLCAAAAQLVGARKRSRKGAFVKCEMCPKEVWRYDCELALEHIEGVFCSYKCHAEHRRLYPWPGYRDFLSPAASPEARSRVICPREGRAKLNTVRADGRRAKGREGAMEVGKAAVEWVRTHPNAARTKQGRRLLIEAMMRNFATSSDVIDRGTADKDYERARVWVVRKLRRAHGELGEPPELTSFA